MNNLALDCETDLIAPGRLAPRLACISIAQDNKDPMLFSPEEGIEYFFDWIMEGEGWLVGHNIAFDLFVILREQPKLAPFVWKLYNDGRVWDCGLHERLYVLGCGWSIHPAIGKPIVTGGVSLADLSKGLIGIDYGDTKTSTSSPRMHYRELIGVPIEQYPPSAKEYALLDAKVTLEVFNYQLSRCYETSWCEKVDRGFGLSVELPSQSLQVKSAWALHHLGARGLKTTEERYKEWSDKLAKELEPLTEVLRAHNLFKGEKNTKNLAVIRKRIELAYGDNTPKTSKGTIQTSTEVLLESNDPILQDLAKWLELDKLRGSFGTVLESAVQYPISPRWNTLVRSGRTSCTKPNLQQLPKSGGVREAFTPREGFVFVGADYSTAELLALARVCEEMNLMSQMAKAIRAGYDLHLVLASQLLNITYDEAFERYENKDEEVLKFRQLAKIPNFGLPGGLGIEGLKDFAKSSYGINISLQEAGKLKYSWLKQWSEMGAYFRNIDHAVQKGFIVQSYTKRRRGGIGYTDGANTMFQGLIADGAKQALYDVVKNCYMNKQSALFGSYPVLFIHDEIIIESPEDKAPGAGKALAEIMIKAMQPCLPNFPVKVDAWISDYWSKKNYTVFDEAGNLKKCSL